MSSSLLNLILESNITFFLPKRRPNMSGAQFRPVRIIFDKILSFHWRLIRFIKLSEVTTEKIVKYSLLMTFFNKHD